MANNREVKRKKKGEAIWAESGEREREKRYIYKTTTNQKDGTKSRLAPVARLFASETSSVRELIITRLAVSFKKDETARRQFLFFIGHVGHAGQPSPAYLHTNVNRILCKFLFYFFVFFLEYIDRVVYFPRNPSFLSFTIVQFFLCVLFFFGGEQSNKFCGAITTSLCVHTHNSFFFQE